jgi:quinol-cytochrome oxidoreductase complex cytochrome b subunit
MKFDQKAKQIFSWPFLIIGLFSILHGIAVNGNDSFIDLFFIFLILGLFLRKDYLDKRLQNEFLSKHKWYIYIGVTIICFSSLGFLGYVLFNIKNIRFSECALTLALCMGVALAYLFLPFEIWLFKRYKKHNNRLVSDAGSNAAI